MTKFTVWYHGRSEREQRLLSLMTILIVGCMGYYNLWIPTDRHLNEARQEYVRQWNLLQWIEDNKSLVQPSSNEAAGNDTTPLPVLLTKTTKESGLPITRLDAGADGKAMLTLDNVSFNSLITWLDKFQREHHATLLSANIAPSDTPGEVNATLQLEK